MKLNFRKAIVVAIIVGSILVVINQWQGLFTEAPLDLLKIALTYMVPFCVFLWGQWSASKERHAGELELTAGKMEETQAQAINGAAADEIVTLGRRYRDPR